MVGRRTPDAGTGLSRVLIRLNVGEAPTQAPPSMQPIGSSGKALAAKRLGSHEIEKSTHVQLTMHDKDRSRVTCNGVFQDTRVDCGQSGPEFWGLHFRQAQ